MSKYFRDIEVGECVRVHRNLNNGKMSVLSWNDKYNDKARVIAHIDDIMLENCKMIVQPSGSEKTKENSERNVHAFVQGYVIDEDLKLEYDGKLTYNPFEDDSFKLIYKNKKHKITKCKYVNITEGKHVLIKK